MSANLTPGWECWERQDFVEIIPQLDLHPHIEGIDCECRPFWETDAILVHNSFDGREHIENIPVKAN